MSDTPMFEVPRRWQPPKRPPKSDSWRKATGPPVSCDMCVLDLHHGNPDGPLDRARHRVVRASGKVWMVCPRHATAVQSGERSLPDG